MYTAIHIRCYSLGKVLLLIILLRSFFLSFFFFFFQAEDGIRDVAVTGVQTCALPIFCTPCSWRRDPQFEYYSNDYARATARSPENDRPGGRRRVAGTARGQANLRPRSEERRVGKECRYGG